MKIIGDHILKCQYRKVVENRIKCSYYFEQIKEFDPSISALENSLVICAYDKRWLDIHECFPNDLPLGKFCPLNRKNA
jgi:hypothetical protein